MGHEASFHLTSWEQAPRVREQDQPLFISPLVPPVPSSEGTHCHTGCSPQQGRLSRATARQTRHRLLQFIAEGQIQLQQLVSSGGKRIAGVFYLNVLMDCFVKKGTMA